MNDKYLKIYKKYIKNDEEILSLYKIAVDGINNNTYKKNSKIILDTTYTVVAPTLIIFVYETMIKAKKDGINKLFFLARDGYILYKIAEVLNTLEFGFELKYLYCSRLSLRRPLYFKFDEYSLKMMFKKNKNMSVESILKGIGFETYELQAMYNKLEINHIPLNKSLVDYELEIVKKSIYNIKDDICKKSYAFFKDTYEYFFQNGLINSNNYGIVDSGWEGSIQESLYRLVKEFGNSNVKINGYYFGIFRKFDINSNSKYNGWYFDKNSKLSKISKFNINLFESLTISPHGMTLYYTSDEKGSYIPVLKGNKSEFIGEFESIQYEETIKMAKLFVKNTNIQRYKINHIRVKIVQGLLEEFMYNTSYEEALVYGIIPFSDAPTDENKEPLCRALTKFELLNCLFVIKTFIYIYNKLFIKRKIKSTQLPFWGYGSVQLSKTKCKEIFKINLYFINYMYNFINIKL